MYKSYHYNDMPRAVLAPSKEQSACNEPAQCEKQFSLNSLLGDLKNDDIVLLVIIFILLIDDCDDKLLLIALGFIFFTGLGE